MTKLIELIKIWSDAEEIKANLDYYAHVNDYMNQQDEDGMTPLAYLSGSGDIDIVKLLIDAGVDINCTTKNNFTALHFAAFGNKIEIAKLLIEKGIDVTIRNINGQTALDIAKHYSKDYSSPEMIQLLEETSNYLMFNGKKYKLVEEIT